MSGTYIWGDMGRTTTDPTTVDEAISEAIDAHLADPDAHLDSTGSLQSHRASEIIDHLAESVVNDKIKAVARTYVAIVDPDSVSDFDTIEAAIAYALTKGGGNIFIVPGHHYLSTIVELDGTVNFYGGDPDTTFIHTDYSNDMYFQSGHWDEFWPGSFEFEGLTLHTESIYFIHMLDPEATPGGILNIRNCTFTGAGNHLNQAAGTVNMSQCTCYLTDEGILGISSGGLIENIKLQPSGEDSVGQFMAANPFGWPDTCMFLNIDGRAFPQYGPTDALDFFGGAGLYNCTFMNCIFNGVDPQKVQLIASTLIRCDWFLRDTKRQEMDFRQGSMITCSFIANASAGFLMNSSSYGYTIIGCQLDGGASSTNNAGVMFANDLTRDYNSLASSTTALAMDVNNVAQLTPNSTRTVTTAVPTAGQRRTLIILTSGTTSYTITFGTGFKTTGTLATGATSARRFVLEFISDGTQLIETSRTTAIA